MTPKNIINDVHLGVKRMGGTTPLTQGLVQQGIQDSFHGYLMTHTDADLVINGDLFDGFSVDVVWVVACYMSLVEWFAKSDHTLYLVAGNHDIGKRNDRKSSFDVLADLLSERFPTRTIVVKNEPYSEDGMHIIPHMLNQDIFNMALEQALSWEPGWLLLHANVDNGFAEESDHSLNVSREQLLELSKTHKLLFAHEHQARDVEMPGNRHAIRVLGNQWPTSIVDCRSADNAQLDGCKYAHQISDSGITEEETWRAEDDYSEVDWTGLFDTNARFLRVTGTAGASQAADVITAIAKFRQNSEAWVITNGVKIEGIQDSAEIHSMTLERLSSINILDELIEHLTDAEAVVVKKLLAEGAAA